MPEYIVERLARGSGSIIQGIGAETIPRYSLVHLNNLERWALSDADAMSSVPVVGLAADPISVGQKGRILLQGVIHNNEWNWTPGEEVYASQVAGELTQAAPKTPAISQVVGVAESATVLIFHPKDATTGSVSIRVNSGDPLGPYACLNFVDGTLISITGVDDDVNREVIITVNNDGIVARKAAGADQGPQPRLSFIDGTNITTNVVNDISNNEIDITVNNDGETIRLNSGANVGTRPRLNLIDGTNISIVAVDDAVGNEVDITVNSATALTVRRGAGADQGPQPRLSFIDGTNITTIVANDAPNNEVDITITNDGETVRVDGGADVGTRPRLNLIQGDATYLTVGAVDDVPNTEVDVTFTPLGIGVRERPAATQGPRNVVNFVEGANTTIGIADNVGNQEVDITIASAGTAGCYAEAHITAGGLITVDTVNAWHAVTNFVSDDISGITFNAGSTGTITAYADAGGGQVTVTSVGHGLSNGDIITITGSTNYNDIFEISNVGVNDFEITDVWAGDDGAGTWRNGSNFVIEVEAVYLLTWQISGNSTIKDRTFAFTHTINDIAVLPGLQRQRFNTAGEVENLAGSFIIDDAVGDIIAFNLRNEVDNSNFTIEQATINLHRID